MSALTKHSPRGAVSSRATNAWKSAFASHKPFVHSAPDSLLTENLPPPTSPRFPFSLNATLATFPHLETVWIEDWSEDCQIATQPKNIPAAVHRIAGERFNPCDIGSGLLIP